VARGGIPPAVRALIAEHVHSITQLDLLLLVYGAGHRALTAAEVCRRLRIPERLATGQLLDFTAAGLLAADLSELRTGSGLAGLLLLLYGLIYDRSPGGRA
jgi:hypothetical protein